MLLSSAIAMSLVGCSNTVAVDVAYPQTGVNRATLASVRPRRVEIRPVTDRPSGKPLFTRRYVGIKRQTADREATQAARDVMDAALARAMHDLATDPELAQAFGDSRPDVQRI